jgi:hypothetical protein
MTLWRSAQFRSPRRETKECVDDRARLQTVLNCAVGDPDRIGAMERSTTVRAAPVSE